MPTTKTREASKKKQTRAIAVRSAEQADAYGETLMARVVKAQGDTKSRQVEDPFAELYGIGGAIQPPLDPLRLLNLIEQNAIHSACVTAKADDSTGRGWNLEATTKDVDTALPEKITALMESLTPDLSFAELLNQAVWEREAIGWSGWEAVRDDPADPKSNLAALYPVPSHTIRATKDPNVWVQIRGIEMSYFKIFGCDIPYDRKTGKAATKAKVKAGDWDPATEIIIFKTYSPRSKYYGIPKWISAIPAMAELTAIREFNVSFFESGGTADRIIHVTASDGKAAKALADSITEQLRDAAGRGHVTIVTSGATDSGVNPQPLNGPQGQAGQRDAQFVRRREDLVKEVLMAHNVPPYRIGWAELGSLGGSAAKEMMRAYKVGAVEPQQNILEDRLNLSIYGPKGLDLQGYKWVLEDVDWSETDLDLTFATQGRDHGILTGNEARKVIGHERFEDPAMDRITYAGPAPTPVTTTSEAQTLTAIIGELKTALEAAIRGEAPPPPVPPGPPGADGQPPEASAQDAGAAAPAPAGQNGKKPAPPFPPAKPRPAPAAVA